MAKNSAIVSAVSKGPYVLIGNGTTRSTSTATPAGTRQLAATPAGEKTETPRSEEATEAGHWRNPDAFQEELAAGEFARRTVAIAAERFLVDLQFALLRANRTEFGDYIHQLKFRQPSVFRGSCGFLVDLPQPCGKNAQRILQTKSTRRLRRPIRHREVDASLITYDDPEVVTATTWN